MIVPSLATFLITLVNITVLYFLLRAFLFKPVTKFMEDRAGKVRESLDQAEKERLQAKDLLRQYEDRLKGSEEEAAEIIRSAKETAGAEAGRIVAEARAQAELLIRGGRDQLEAERRAAMTVFRADAAALVMSASSRLIRRELSSEDSLRQADLLLGELAAPEPERS
jgi:F-type H+-transporting ATPase subunit b